VFLVSNILLLVCVYNTFKFLPICLIGLSCILCPAPPLLRWAHLHPVGWSDQTQSYVAPPIPFQLVPSSLFTRKATIIRWTTDVYNTAQHSSGKHNWSPHYHQLRTWTRRTHIMLDGWVNGYNSFFNFTTL
jgi:hypothetical protein